MRGPKKLREDLQEDLKASKSDSSNLGKTLLQEIIVKKNCVRKIPRPVEVFSDEGRCWTV